MYGFGIVLGWFAALFLPHFQNSFNAIMITLQLLISIFLLHSFKFYTTIGFNFSESIIKYIYFLICITHLTALILATLNMNALYISWNRLGAGTMFQGKNLFYWGDLAHIFSAVNCRDEVIIGQNACDPWSRPFNQNPHIIKFLELSNITSLFIVGLISTLIFYIIYFKIVLMDSKNHLQYIIFLISPPIILALDRGNEIITFNFMIIGLYFLQKNTWTQSVGAISLALASFYKLWPVVLILLILLFAWKNLQFGPKVFMGLAIFYWILNFSNATKMVNYTDIGSPLGLSFGLKHFLNGSMPVQINFILSFSTILITLRYFYLIREFGVEFTSNLFAQKIFLSLIITYISLWFFGTNYVYRLIILVPISLYISIFLSTKRMRAELLALFLLIFLTSRLTITNVFTSSLALIFIFIGVILGLKIWYPRSNFSFVK